MNQARAGSGNDAHLAVLAGTRSMVDRFDTAGPADADTPGARCDYHARCHGALPSDPHGDKVEAVTFPRD